jgi:hypothetical protein
MQNSLNGFTAGMLATAYQAGWNALFNRWRQSQTYAVSTIREAVHMLRADMNRWSLLLWLGLNLLPMASGLFLASMNPPWWSFLDGLLIGSGGVINNKPGTCILDHLRRREKDRRDHVEGELN